MIYFYVYPSAFQNPGGGEILLLKTKEYLEKQGIKIQLFDMWNDRLQKGDILHVFGSVKEALGLIEIAKTKGVKIVHSPIIWYNWQSTLCIAYHLKDRLLCILRQAAKTFCPMIPSARKKMMGLADVVLAGSQMEANQINRYFLIPKDRIKTIHYGVDKIFDGVDKQLFERKFGLKDFVLTVGRIEPRKNQLHFIRAMRGIGRPIVIIGGYVSTHKDYFERCQQEADSNVHFLGELPMDSEELRSAYAACNTFVLATWFETPGLAALEAALAGAKIVITREGSTKEYFKEFVEYINPASVSDIRKKTESVLKQLKDDRLRNHIQKHCLWEHAATKTIELYRELGLQIETEKAVRK